MENKKNRLKKALTFILKLGITASGFYLVFRSVDFEQIRFDFTLENIGLFLVAFAMSLIAETFAVRRFEAVADTDLKNIEFFKINLIGRFFNLFLPTSIGGDVIRAVKLGSATKAGAKSTVTIFIDRLTGISIVALISSVTSLILMITGNFEIIPLVGKISIFALSSLVVLAWIIIFIRPLFDLTIKIIEIFPIKKIRDFAIKTLESFEYVRKLDKRNLATGFINSVFVQICTSLVVYLLGLMLDLNVPIYYVIVFRAIGDLLLLAPISINGLGVRDYIFKFLYEPVTNSPNVVLLSPFLFLVLALQGAIGGILYMTEKSKIEDLKEKAA